MSSPTVQAISRLNDAERDRTQRFAWAVLGSAWVHILITVCVFVGIRCEALTGAEARDERSMAVMLIEPPEKSIPAREKTPDTLASDPDFEAPEAQATLAVGQADVSTPSGAPDLEALQALSPEEIALLDPAILQELDPAALAELDPELLAAIDLERLATLDVRTLASLDPEVLATLPAANPKVQAALAAQHAKTPQGTAAKPETTPPAQIQPSPGVDETTEAPESPGADPDDAVADAALQEAPETLDAEEDQDPPEKDEEPEPEPEPEPPPPPSIAPRFQRYIHAPEDQSSATASLDSTLISSRDLRSEELRRVEVTSDIEGDQTPPLDGLPMTAGTPSMDLQNGDPLTDGGDLGATGEPMEQPEVEQLGGGDDGPESGRGAPNHGEGTRGGALARSGRRALASSSALVIAGGGAPTLGKKEAPKPDDRPRRRDGWWAPTVARVVIQAPEVVPAEAPITAALETEEVDRAPVPKPDDRADRGGTEQDVEVDEELPEAAEPTEDTDSGEAEPEEVEEEPPEPVESVADFRASMGWPGREDARSKPRRTMPGIETTEGNKRTSQLSTDEELLLDRFASVDAAGTAVGRYRAKLDAEIRTQWHTMDLSLHERALGIQGSCEVVFHIQPNGKVTEKTLLRKSGYASLDAMALDAIPDRLPRFPKDIDAPSLFHAYTFIYRNPLIVGGDAE